MINPLWLAAMRRQWPLVGAIIIFLLFLLAHAAFFQPAAERYRRALSNAENVGLALEPAVAAEVIPPRVYAMLAENALPASTAKEEGESGSLSASLIETVSRLASKRRMDVVVTEPAPTAQQPHAVIVRAHMRVRCNYSTFVAFLEDLAAQDKLLAVDRFTIQPGSDGNQIADLYVSRYVLKQAPVKP